MSMSIDECIAYLEKVSSERKPRSRKARKILKYLNELKQIRGFSEFLIDKCARLEKENAKLSQNA